MNMSSMKKALIAGVMGTVAMTGFTYLASMIHLPKADYAAFFTSQFGSSVGWLAFLAAGVVMAHFFGSFRKKLPFHSWKRGVLYAAAIWGVVQMILMPIFGAGFFPGTALTAFGALLTLAAYGATVGYLYDH